MIKQLYLIFATIFLIGGITPSQQTDPVCKTPIEYEYRNVLDPKPFVLVALEGKALTGTGTFPQGSTGQAVGACLGLFTEKDHTLVASAVTDKDGRFKFDSIPLGEYRLVVKAKALCTANIPLRVVRKSSGKHKHIVVHMRPAGLDSCSFAEVQSSK